MLPGLSLMTFFVWEPLFESIRMGLYKTRNVELVRFIGLDNFISVVSKDDFMQALMNTFSYTFWSLLLGFALPVLLAMLIGETRRGKGFFRTAVYLPNMLPGLAVIILWSAFFSGEKSGVLNILLSRLGIPQQTYLTRADWVIPIIILILVIPVIVLLLIVPVVILIVILIIVLAVPVVVLRLVIIACAAAA